MVWRLHRGLTDRLAGSGRFMRNILVGLAHRPSPLGQPTPSPRRKGKGFAGGGLGECEVREGFALPETHPPKARGLWKPGFVTGDQDVTAASDKLDRASDARRSKVASCHLMLYVAFK